MTWVQQLKREYADGARKLESYRDRIRGNIDEGKDASYLSDEAQHELTVVEEMIADMNYALEWMRTGRRPHSRRGTDIRDAYSRSILMDMDLMPNTPPEQEMRFTQQQKDQMVRILMRLSTRERQCYLLHMAQGLSFGEIGKEMKLSRPSVQRYVERAKAKVAEAI